MGVWCWRLDSTRTRCYFYLLESVYTMWNKLTKKKIDTKENLSLITAENIDIAMNRIFKREKISCRAREIRKETPSRASAGLRRKDWKKKREWKTSFESITNNSSRGISSSHFSRTYGQDRENRMKKWNEKLLVKLPRSESSALKAMGNVDWSALLFFHLMNNHKSLTTGRHIQKKRRLAFWYEHQSMAEKKVSHFFVFFSSSFFSTRHISSRRC